MKKVLFIDRVHPILEEELTKNGFICEADYSGNYEVIKNKLSDYHGLVIRSRIPVDQAFLKAGSNLEFIARSGAGLENIDLAAAKECGIAVYNSPEGNMDAVGEHAIGMLLSLFNYLNKADREVRAGIWDREGNRGLELAGRTVGIIGFGHMGSALAKKLSGFDCRILAYDKYKKGYAPTYVEEVSLDIVKAESDVISIHLPLSEETDRYVDTEFIRSCKKPFFLINTARGRHVVISDLLKGLDGGSVQGACLDVLEYEKKSFDLTYHEMPESFRLLAENERVILSPHVAGWTRESYLKLSSFLAEKILKTSKGKGN
ncbi:NAD(P)-dependent oxidoreductase [Cryomorphaceae bacterium 1068]|nr:NAD(P)-dependent oxidoreductase [Cryomorphaceae bacterium 1068]